MSQLNDDELLEYIYRIKKLRRPKDTDIDTADTDVYTGDTLICGVAWLLMIKNLEPDYINYITSLRDMTKFLASLKNGIDEYLKNCSDKEKCEQFPMYVHTLTVIYNELLARGIKAYPFVHRLRFEHKSPIDDHILLEYISRVQELPLPSSEEIKTQDTDADSGKGFILGAADALLVKKLETSEIYLHDMTMFLASLLRGIYEYERTCPDKKKCERYLHCIQLLQVIYDELIERGIVPVAFPYT